MISKSSETTKACLLKKLKGTGVQSCLDSAVFDLLKMKPIFPGGVSKLEDSKGNVLPDCFLMNENATALDFAFRLHTDFGKNFIKAINVKTKTSISIPGSTPSIGATVIPASPAKPHPNENV